MFLESSRYYKVRMDIASAKDGRQVKVVTLRRLPAVRSQRTMVIESDRLDVMAYRRFENATMFWRIADANTELQAQDLVKEPGAIINTPEQ